MESFLGLVIAATVILLAVIAAIYSEKIFNRLRYLQQFELYAKKSSLSPGSDVVSVFQYAQTKGSLAAKEIKLGRGDAGHLRDLADAAVIGCEKCALAIAEITLQAKVVDASLQRVQAHAWLSIALKNRAGYPEALDALGPIERSLSEKERGQSDAIVTLAAQRRAFLLTRPDTG